MILAFETATDVCSVALRDRAGTVHEKRTEQKGSHSEQVFLFTRELMEEQKFGMSDLDAVLISEGPGSYTGLRIAASAVKGLLYGTGTPLLAVHTLAAFAAGVIGSKASSDGRTAREVMEMWTGTIHAVIDARRVHLYHQPFEVRSGKLSGIGEVAVRPLEEVREQITEGDWLTGSGLERIGPELSEGATAFGEDRISARSLLLLRDLPGGSDFVREVDPALFDPRYYSSRQVK